MAFAAMSNGMSDEVKEATQSTHPTDSTSQPTPQDICDNQNQEPAEPSKTQTTASGSSNESKVVPPTTASGSSNESEVVPPEKVSLTEDVKVEHQNPEDGKVEHQNKEMDKEVEARNDEPKTDKSDPPPPHVEKKPPKERENPDKEIASKANIDKLPAALLDYPRKRTRLTFDRLIKEGIVPRDQVDGLSNILFAANETKLNQEDAVPCNTLISVLLEDTKQKNRAWAVGQVIGQYGDEYEIYYPLSMTFERATLMGNGLPLESKGGGKTKQNDEGGSDAKTREKQNEGSGKQNKKKSEKGKDHEEQMQKDEEAPKKPEEEVGGATKQSTENKDEEAQKVDQNEASKKLDPQGDGDKEATAKEENQLQGVPKDDAKDGGKKEKTKDTQAKDVGDAKKEGGQKNEGVADVSPFWVRGPNVAFLRFSGRKCHGWGFCLAQRCKFCFERLCGQAYVLRADPSTKVWYSTMRPPPPKKNIRSDTRRVPFGQEPTLA